MGNPAPQPRTNSPNPNRRPKHRQSGSLSNISFTSEDPKPKHRHSGSVCNISLNLEDAKPKHRQSGSVLSTSLTPEDLKPRHRHNGSVSNISSTPEDVKPRHRPCRSVSNIAINSEDFTSPSRDVRNPSPVSSSSVSVKKRLNRRTRSSLGGTEDFIKALDFLTPSCTGKTLDSSTRKDLRKPSRSLSTSEFALLEAASEALAPVPEASVSAHVKGIVEHLRKEQADNPIIERADVVKNGGSPQDEKSVDSAKGSVQPGDAVQVANPESNGVHRGNPITVETSRDKQDPTMDEIGEYDSQVGKPSALENGHLHDTAAGIPLLGTSTEESDCIKPADVQTQANEVAASIPEVGPPPRSLVSNTASPTIPQNVSDQEEFTKSNNSEPSVTDAALPAPAKGNPEAAPSKEELSQNESGGKQKEEEKVVVQERIEELEKVGGGRPLHFRSQSLSLPRPFKSQAWHHEAEGSKSFRMPLCKASLDTISVSEVGSLDFAGTSQDDERSQEALQCDVNNTPTERPFLIGPGSHESSALDTEPQNVLHDEEGRLASQTVRSARSSYDEISIQTEPHLGPITSQGAKAVDVSPDSMMNGVHVENGTTVGSFPGFSVSEAETTEHSETHGKGHVTTVEQNLVEIGKEGGLESGLEEAYMMVSADSAPEEALVVPKELHSGPPSDQTTGNGGKLEPAEVGVEAPPGAQKVGAELDQTRELPEAAKTETEMPSFTFQICPSPEVPAVRTLTHQSSLYFETSMLLSKQPAVDPLFIDSNQDRLWEMKSQELTMGLAYGLEFMEGSAHDDDPRQYAPEAAPIGKTANGNVQSHISDIVNRLRTPLRSLLVDEDAERCPDSGSLGSSPQTQPNSPRSNIFRRIVSVRKNSPTKQTTSSKFSTKNGPATRPFLSSCMCGSVR